MKLVTTPKVPGIYLNVPAEEYHAWDAISITSLLKLLDSPGHYMYQKMNPIEPTAAMRLGTMIHTYLLEKPDFYKRYLVVPPHIPTDRRKTERKNWEAESIGGDGELVEYEQMKLIDGIYRSIMSRDCASSLLIGQGDAEISLLWEENGLRCKGRIDKYHAETKTLVDLKTTQDASPREFSKAAVRRGYHIQQAHYYRGAFQLGMEIDQVVLLAVETTAPFGNCVYQFPEELLAKGDEQRRRLLTLLKQEQAKNKWEVYPDEVVSFSYSSYDVGMIDETLDFFIEGEEDGR